MHELHVDCFLFFNSVHRNCGFIKDHRKHLTLIVFAYLASFIDKTSRQSDVCGIIFVFRTNTVPVLLVYFTIDEDVTNVSFYPV